MTDFNNRYLGTRSSKVRRIVPIKNFIIHKIDTNQNIKRLCRYYTKTPLLNRGVGYDGTVVNQPDLEDSLLKPVHNDLNVSPTARNQILTTSVFSGDVLAERQITIYVHHPKSVFNPNMVSGRISYGVDPLGGRHLFMVDIVYPNELNELDSVNQERATEIAGEIIDMLDGIYVDGEYEEFTGACKLNVEGEITCGRLSTSGYLILSIPIWVSATTGRIDSDMLGGDTRYA